MAARTTGGNEAQTAEGLQKQMESLQKELGKADGKPEAVDQLKKDLEKLQEAAKALADCDTMCTCDALRVYDIATAIVCVFSGAPSPLR